MAYPATPLGLRVRIAPGDSVLTDPAGWTWVDISSYVRTPRGQPTVSIGHGKIGNVRETLPASASLMVENADNRFSVRNPNGPWYGQLTENTPLDIAVDAGAGWSTRFTGGLEKLPREWNSGGRNSWVTLTGRGTLHRLTQRGKTLKSALARHMEQNTWNDLIGCWLMEDAADSTFAAGALLKRSQQAPRQVKPMWVGGSARFGQAAKPSGVASLVDLSGGYLAANLPVGLDTNEWRVECVAQGDPGSPITAQTRIASWITRGPVVRWDLVANDGVVAIHGYTATEFLQAINFTATFDADDGDLHHYRVDAYDNVGTLTVELWIDGELAGTDTLAATTTHQPTYIRAHPDAESFALPMSALMVWSTRPSTTPTQEIVDAAFGWVGETADQRFSRTAQEELINLTMPTLGDQFVCPMGPQTPGTLIDIWRQAERTEYGLLMDDVDGKVRWRTSLELYNQTAALSLSYTGRQIAGPFLPADDTQLYVNDATARKPNGASARSYDQADIDRRGTFDEPFDVNPDSDYTLDGIASFYKQQGMVDADRYDNIRLNMAHPQMTAKIADWLTVRPGSRLAVTSLPLTVHPEGTNPDLMVAGWVEDITLPRQWTADLACVPYQPYNVGVVGTDKLQTAKSVFGDDGAGLSTSVTSSATSIPVVTMHGPKFTTTGGHYPTLMQVGGEHVNVTAMANTAITFVAAGTAAHDDNQSVGPTVPAGAQQGDLLLIFAAIRSTSAQPFTPVGWSTLIQNGNIAVYHKVHDGSEATPTVTFIGGAAGDTTSAQMVAFRGAFSLATTQGIFLRYRTQDNASAQDVAYPSMRVPAEHSGGLVLYLGWKQDDWTSVASPGTEIGEPGSTLGNDQGIVWSYQIQTTPVDVAAGSFVVTGGAAAISKSMLLLLRSNVQTATVARSQNGIVKAHSALDPIKLVAPIIGARDSTI